jgi:peptide methionine sulfoxide reductase msrA/msrB
MICRERKSTTTIHLKASIIMKITTIFVAGLVLFATGCSRAQETEELKTAKQSTPPLELVQDSASNNNWNKLTEAEAYVIEHKGTERPYTGKYYDSKDKGIYTCKRCDAPLFKSSAKFNSGTGWPSFDSYIGSAVQELLDADGYRSEIICANCKGHLGHVFLGEGFTDKNTRHCVNSIALSFKSENQLKLENQQNTAMKLDSAIFASGCFWGTEYFFEKEKGVKSTQVGYIGGNKEEPTYKEVCTGKTGHAEAVKVVFNPEEITYEKLARLFFETHDPTQINRQGPDIGTQYRSEIFYLNDLQKATALKLVNLLEDKGFDVATKVTKATTFWEGEDYHEHYYTKKGGTPYCHGYTKRF